MPPRTTTALRDPRELMAAVLLARNVYYNISRCSRAKFRVARRTSFRLRPETSVVNCMLRNVQSLRRRSSLDGAQFDQGADIL